jgi:hypothetical protein
MQIYQGYVEHGKIIPLGNTAIPEGSRVSITIADGMSKSESMLERQKEALRALEKGLEECDEPLPSDFDEILSKRVNITRICLHELEMTPCSYRNYGPELQRFLPASR